MKDETIITASKLHTQRRKRVEKFLREIGVEPAERVRASRNPLELVWSLGEEEIVRVEREIDERVKSLYGL
jgi:hypothetical protein